MADILEIQLCNGLKSQLSFSRQTLAVSRIPCALGSEWAQIPVMGAWSIFRVPGWPIFIVEIFLGTFAIIPGHTCTYLEIVGQTDPELRHIDRKRVRQPGTQSPVQFWPGILLKRAYILIGITYHTYPEMSQTDPELHRIDRKMVRQPGIETPGNFWLGISLEIKGITTISIPMLHPL